MSFLHELLIIGLLLQVRYQHYDKKITHKSPNWFYSCPWNRPQFSIRPRQAHGQPPFRLLRQFTGRNTVFCQFQDIPFGTPQGDSIHAYFPILFIFYFSIKGMKKKIPTSPHWSRPNYFAPLSVKWSGSFYSPFSTWCVLWSLIQRPPLLWNWSIRPYSSFLMGLWSTILVSNELILQDGSALNK